MFESVLSWIARVVFSPVAQVVGPELIAITAALLYRSHVEQVSGPERWLIAGELLTSSLGVFLGGMATMSYRIVATLNEGSDVGPLLVKVLGSSPVVLMVFLALAAVVAWLQRKLDDRNRIIVRVGIPSGLAAILLAIAFGLSLTWNEMTVELIG